MRILFTFLVICQSLYIHSQNLLNNGGFENDLSLWTNNVNAGASATFTLSSDAVQGVQSLQIDVAQAGTNAWDVQSTHDSWPAVLNKEYRLRFWAKAQVGGSQIRVAMQQDTYAQFNFTIGESWTAYEQTFVAKEDTLQLKLHFLEAGNFTIDDISIEEITSSTDATFDVNPAVTYQTMMGFGGAMTWYSDRVYWSPQKSAIYDLIFKDLGLDMLRLKNWYYPVNYPTNTSTTTMEESWFRDNLLASQEFYNQAKTQNPNTKVFVSSWGPPTNLKSNGSLVGGTLLKSNGEFDYSAFATYWVDVLDNLGFDPDWISIQNEPSYIASWTTSEWRPTETVDFPGYDQAFDSVYNRIKDRPNSPKMIGPESEGIGRAKWDDDLNTFREFANPIKNHPGLFAYAYHVYSFYNSESIETRKWHLNIIRDEFGEKPNIMTEYSKVDIPWIDNASIIQNCLSEANADAYVYWNMIWDENTSDAMIQVEPSGNYTVTPYYYLMKHYAKYIDEGDIRVSLTGSNEDVKGTAFKNTAGDSLVIILSNATSGDANIQLNLSDTGFDYYKTIQSVSGGNYYEEIDLTSVDAFTLPGMSLTTMVMSTNPAVSTQPETVQNTISLFPNPATSTIEVLANHDLGKWSIIAADGMKVMEGTGTEIDVSSLATGMYLFKTNELSKRLLINH